MAVINNLLSEQENLGDTDFKIIRFYHKGIPIFRASTGKDTGKSEVGLAKMLAFHNKGVSDTTWRTEQTSKYHPGLVDERAEMIANIYRKEVPDANMDTVVLGSAHRIGVYLAAATNSLFLPMQFLSFLETWKQTEDIVTPAIIGCDYDADPMLYAWLKPKLPQAYKELLKNTKNIILARSTNREVYRKFGKNQVHFSAFDPKYDFFKAPKILLSEALEEYNWEFGLRDEQVDGIREYCRESCKNLLIVEGTKELLNCKISGIVHRLYQKNRVEPQRFVFNSYWISHPYYEFSTLSVPFCTYRLLTKRNLDFIGKFQQKTKILNADAFVNDFGGDGIQNIEKYLYAYFNIESFCKGADTLDKPDSSSSYIARRLTEIQPRKWKFLSMDDLRYLKK